MWTETPQYSGVSRPADRGLGRQAAFGAEKSAWHYRASRRSWNRSSEQRVHSDLLVFRTFLYLAGDSGGFAIPGSLPILFSSPLPFPSLHLLIHPLFLSSTDSVITVTLYPGCRLTSGEDAVWG